MNDYGFNLEQEANFLAAKKAHELMKRLHIERTLKLVQLRLTVGSEEEYQQLLAREGIKNV